MASRSWLLIICEPCKYRQCDQPRHFDSYRQRNGRWRQLLCKLKVRFKFRPHVWLFVCSGRRSPPPAGSPRARRIVRMARYSAGSSHFPRFRGSDPGHHVGDLADPALQRHPAQHAGRNNNQLIANRGHRLAAGHPRRQNDPRCGRYQTGEHKDNNLGAYHRDAGRAPPLHCRQ